MKPWKRQEGPTVVGTMPGAMPAAAVAPAQTPTVKDVASLECLYGPHKGELQHKGTIYCRKCYDDKNLHGELIN